MPPHLIIFFLKLFKFQASPFFNFLLTFSDCRYIENVFPGEFGLPKPFYFFLMTSYWCGVSSSRPGSVTDMNTKKSLGPNFEEEPEGGEIGVSIQDLRKVYKVIWSSYWKKNAKTRSL